MTDKNFGEHEKPVFLDMGSTLRCIPVIYHTINDIDYVIRSVNLEGTSFNPQIESKKMHVDRFLTGIVYVPEASMTCTRDHYI